MTLTRVNMTKSNMFNSFLGLVMALTITVGSRSASALEGATAAQVSEAVAVVQALRSSTLAGAEASLAKILGAQGAQALIASGAFALLHKAVHVDRTESIANLEAFVKSNQLSTTLLMVGASELSGNRINVASLGKTNTIATYVSAMADKQKAAQAQSAVPTKRADAASDAVALDAYNTAKFTSTVLQARQAELVPQRSSGAMTEKVGMGRVIAASAKTCSIVGSAVENCQTVVNRTVENFYTNTLNMLSLSWFKTGKDLALRYAFGAAVLLTQLGHPNTAAIVHGYDRIQGDAVSQGAEAYYSVRPEMKKCDLGQGDEATAAATVSK